jgi:hypothetical protein
VRLHQPYDKLYRPDTNKHYENEIDHGHYKAKPIKHIDSGCLLPTNYFIGSQVFLSHLVESKIFLYFIEMEINKYSAKRRCSTGLKECGVQGRA